MKCCRDGDRWAPSLPSSAPPDIRISRTTRRKWNLHTLSPLSICSDTDTSCNQWRYADKFVHGGLPSLARVTINDSKEVLIPEQESKHLECLGLKMRSQKCGTLGCFFCLQQPLNLQPNTKCLTRRLICLVSPHAEFTREHLVIITTATRVPEEGPLCQARQTSRPPAGCAQH